MVVAHAHGLPGFAKRLVINELVIAGTSTRSWAVAFLPVATATGRCGGRNAVTDGTALAVRGRQGAGRAPVGVRIKSTWRTSRWFLENVTPIYEGGIGVSLGDPGVPPGAPSQQATWVCP